MIEIQVLKAIQYLVFANCNCERARGGGEGLCKGCFALSDKLTVSLNTFETTGLMNKVENARRYTLCDFLHE